MSLTVELRPHIATEKRQVGGAIVERQVKFDQCYVLVNGKQVAWYCGKQHEDGTYEPNRFLSFIRYQPPDVQKMLAEEVAKITGGVSSYQSVPKPEHNPKGK